MHGLAELNASMAPLALKQDYTNICLGIGNNILFIVNNEWKNLVDNYHHHNMLN